MMHLMLAGLLACSTPTPSSSSTSETSPAAQPGPAQPGPAQPGSVDVAGLKAAVDAGSAVVIDVRTDDEYNSGHVPGARHIPLNDLPSKLDNISNLRDREVYLICAVGGRSQRAATLLAREGFTHPINVEGGTDAWREAGYPLD